MLPKSRFVLAGFIIIVLAFMLSYTASASSTQGPLAAGTTRYAVVSSTSSESTTAISFVSLPGLSTKITIPSGKKGDIMVAFCGDTSTTGITEVRAMIGNVAGTPPFVDIMKTNPNFENRCANFYRLNTPAGNVPVKMEWEGQWVWGGTQSMSTRNMIVTANIH